MLYDMFGSEALVFSADVAEGIANGLGPQGSALGPDPPELNAAGHFRGSVFEHCFQTRRRSRWTAGDSPRGLESKSPRRMELL
jgi:hypothetical protein